MEQPGGRSIFDEQEIINSEIIRELHMPKIQENSKFHLKCFRRNHDVFGRNLTGREDLVGLNSNPTVFELNLTGLADLVGFCLVSFESLPTKIGRNLTGFNYNVSEFGRNLTGLADLVGFYLVGFFLAGFYPPNFYKKHLFVQNSYFYPIQLQ
jgi:hypothetical protein